MSIKSIALSSLTKVIWGKLSHDGSRKWLPLWLHLYDACEVSNLLWDHWLPEHTKQIIVQGISDIPIHEKDKMLYGKKVAAFMAAVHDIGKVSPIFQAKADKVGFSEVVDEITGRGLEIFFNKREEKKLTHAIIGQKILELQGLDRSYAIIIGGHHGKPPDLDKHVERVDSYPGMTGVGKSGWDGIQKELVKFALTRAGLDSLPCGSLALTSQVLLTGILIMADWIASGEGFSLISRDYTCQPVETSEKRAYTAWKQLQFPEFGDFSDACAWSSLYAVRFGINTPRPVQSQSIQAALAAEQPGIFIIEAPMGEGKTEAALAVAEVLARRYKTSGIYFALPTQATSDGIFKRIKNWIIKLHPEKPRSVFLAHGKAGFNKDYEGIKLQSNIYNYEDRGERGAVPSEAVLVHDWTQGRKKGLLSDFVVGTIDQILMCGLKHKHLALRHLGIANKVVVIDECHAYDTYMSSYLDLVLSWLGAYQIPVIVLSATLPPHRRHELIKAYKDSRFPKKKKGNEDSFTVLRNQKKSTEELKTEPFNSMDYPLISYTDGSDSKEIRIPNSGRRLQVKMGAIEEEKLIAKVRELLTEGGCVGIIRNTVSKAQETARILAEYFVEEQVRLVHSRFVSCDRVGKEDEIRLLLGPGEKQRPKLLIVVGTQVLEQSLDVDFDILFTDLCPMDLLLQRIGRLHRHMRKWRPSKLQDATCFIIGQEQELEFEAGTAAVYGEYLLLKTKAFLEPAITIPDQIPLLVQQVYEKDNEEAMVAQLQRKYGIREIESICSKALKNYIEQNKKQKDRSQVFQIKKPNQGETLMGWLKAECEQDASGKRAEATVRDTDPSLEVLVIRKKEDGHLYTLPWLAEYADTRIEGVPGNEQAKVIAGCSVSLPRSFTSCRMIDATINELENLVLENKLEDWYESYWLAGELFLVLNENFEMILQDKIVKYDKKQGLCIERQEV